MALAEGQFRVPQHPACAVYLRLTPDIKEALLTAHAQGKQLSLRFSADSAGAEGTGVLNIGGEQHTFSVSSQKHHDLLQLPNNGYDAEVQACMQHKLQPKRTLDANVAGRVRAAGEEAARKKQEGAAVRLNGTQPAQRPMFGARPSSRSVQRQVTPPPPPASSSPLLIQPNAGNNRTPPPAPLPTQPTPATAAAKSAPAPGPTSGNATGTSSAPVTTGSAAPAPGVGGAATGNAQQLARKVLQPPKPGSLKAAGHKGLTGKLAAATPPLADQGEQGSGSAGPPLAPPVELPAVAVTAAGIKGKEALVVVALLINQANGISYETLMRQLQAVFKKAKRVEAKDYLKRLIDSNTERVPPNRIKLKPEAQEREMAQYEALLKNPTQAAKQLAANGNANGAKHAPLKTAAAGGSHDSGSASLDDSSLHSGQPSPSPVPHLSSNTTPTGGVQNVDGSLAKPLYANGRPQTQQPPTNKPPSAANTNIKAAAGNRGGTESNEAKTKKRKLPSEDGAVRNPSPAAVPNKKSKLSNSSAGPDKKEGSKPLVGKDAPQANAVAAKADGDVDGVDKVKGKAKVTNKLVPGNAPGTLKGIADWDEDEEPVYLPAIAPVATAPKPASTGAQTFQANTGAGVNAQSTAPGLFGRRADGTAGSQQLPQRPTPPPASGVVAGNPMKVGFGFGANGGPPQSTSRPPLHNQQQRLTSTPPPQPAAAAPPPVQQPPAAHSQYPVIVGAGEYMNASQPATVGMPGSAGPYMQQGQHAAQSQPQALPHVGSRASHGSMQQGYTQQHGFMSQHSHEIPSQQGYLPVPTHQGPTQNPYQSHSPYEYQQQAQYAAPQPGPHALYNQSSGQYSQQNMYAHKNQYGHAPTFEQQQYQRQYVPGYAELQQEEESTEEEEEEEEGVQTGPSTGYDHQHLHGPGMSYPSGRSIVPHDGVVIAPPPPPLAGSLSAGPSGAQPSSSVMLHTGNSYEQVHAGAHGYHAQQAQHLQPHRSAPSMGMHGMNASMPGAPPFRPVKSMPSGHAVQNPFAHQQQQPMLQIYNSMAMHDDDDEEDHDQQHMLAQSSHHVHQRTGVVASSNVAPSGMGGYVAGTQLQHRNSYGHADRPRRDSGPSAPSSPHHAALPVVRGTSPVLHPRPAQIPEAPVLKKPRASLTGTPPELPPVSKSTGAAQHAQQLSSACTAGLASVDRDAAGEGAVAGVGFAALYGAPPVMRTTAYNSVGGSAVARPEQLPAQPPPTTEHKNMDATEEVKEQKASKAKSKKRKATASKQEKQQKEGPKETEIPATAVESAIASPPAPVVAVSVAPQLPAPSKNTALPATAPVGIVASATPEPPLPNDDDVWAQVQIHDDPAGDLAEYQKVMTGDAASLSTTYSDLLERSRRLPALSRLETQYKERHSLLVKVQKKRSGIVSQIRALHQRIAAASDSGDAAAAGAAQRDLWLLCAKHYLQLGTWDTVIARTAAWLGEARRLVQEAAAVTDKLQVTKQQQSDSSLGAPALSSDDDCVMAHRHA